MGDSEFFKTAIKDSFHNIKKDILKIQNSIDELKEENSILKNKINFLEKKIKKDNLKKEIVNKIDKNKKNIIKEKIIEMIQFKNSPISYIKEIIVDQQEYCSKASFYRYIEELKKEKKLNQISINKQKVTL